MAPNSTQMPPKIEVLELPKGTVVKHSIGTTGKDRGAKEDCVELCKLVRCPECGVAFDERGGVVGAHALIKGTAGHWIIPTCRTCNSEALNVSEVETYNVNDWFALRAGVMAVRASDY